MSRGKSSGITYYTENDFNNIVAGMPRLIEEINEMVQEKVEPTIEEKERVYDDINDFIRRKGRKVYGGTAIDMALKIKGDPGIYSKYIRADIEFYSPKPVGDMFELCDELHNKGYKDVQGKEAEHEATYHVYVNYHVYCDITYAPTAIYNKIKILNQDDDPKGLLNGIQYVHPHFIHIDQLRIFVNPLGAGEQRWEKSFKRAYKMLKRYPFEMFHSNVNIPEPSEQSIKLMNDIKTKLLSIEPISESSLLFGFSSYLFFVKQSINATENHRQPTRHSNLKVIVPPFIELLSTEYQQTVVAIFDFIKSNVSDPALIKVEEYFPFFQFTDYHTVIYYNNAPIIKIYRSDSQCVPFVKTSQGYKYVSFQHHLMMLLILKFKSFVDGSKDMYHAYSSLISNSIIARNDFLRASRLTLLDGSPFMEFRIVCIGRQVSYRRQCFLRKKEKKVGKKVQTFSYTPSSFDGKTPEETAIIKQKAMKHSFSNISGNIINPIGKRFFVFDEASMSISIRNTETIECTEEIDETTDEVQSCSVGDQLDEPLTETTETDSKTDNITEDSSEDQKEINSTTE